MEIRPSGFLQVDVDGLWAIRRCYGRPEGESYTKDPCWHEGLSRLDKTFQQVGVPASFFIVGKDLELDSKRRIARKLVHKGYELGNHSYTHTLGLTLQPVGFILDEMKRTDHLLRLVGADPIGFRSPGYDIDTRILRVVRQLGYLYDASLMPTYLAPLLRLADAYLSQRWNRGKRQFGRFAYGRAPRQPYFPKKHHLRKPAESFAESGLLEIPVGTTPGLHLPLTASALFPLSRDKRQRLFEKLAKKKRPTLLLLHAIDGVDCQRPIIFRQRKPSIGGFSLSGDQKGQLLQEIVEDFSKEFQIVRTDHFARKFIEEKG